MASNLPAGDLADAGALEKLPIEIRKQIYTYVLVDPKTIAIKRYINHKAYKKGEVARMDHHRKLDRSRKVYDRRRKAWIDAPPSTNSILLVNKTVSSEATPVFYGSNDFFFESAGALQDFLAWVGPARQHLRHVEVDGRGIMFQASWTAMDRSLSLLESSRGLRALHFYHTGFCGGHGRDRTNVSVGDVAVHCSPLLKSLQATWEARNVSMDILDVVKIVLPPCHCKLCLGPKKRCRHYICHISSWSHERYPLRVHIMPGGSAYGELCRPCYCLCEAADDKNRSLNETLKDEIARQLRLDAGHEDS